MLSSPRTRNAAEIMLMTIEHVMVHVEPGTMSEVRLKYAVGLAGQFGSRLTGPTVILPPSEVLLP